MTSVFGYCKGDPSIPIDELDYAYIEKCKDINKLQKILQILRSGEEGRYPALEQFTEKQLAKEKPDSPLLEKCNKEKMMQDMPKDDMMKAVDELKSLSSIPNISSVENGNANDNLPPIRSLNTTENTKEKKEEIVSNDYTKDKKVTPQTPEYWERLSKQVETEDGDFENICKVKPTKLHPNMKTQSKPAHELLTPHQLNLDKSCDDFLNVAAQNEKNKGNEAFRCGDFKEALIYYNRSLDILPTAASYNNRAITLLKLEKFKEALSDCENVITLEPTNIKAYMRRGIANQSLGYAEKALEDFTKVVELEPTNKRGKELLEKVSNELENNNLNTKKKGRRMKIKEINTSLPTEPNESVTNIDKNNEILEENSQINEADETISATSNHSNKESNGIDTHMDVASKDKTINTDNQCSEDFNHNNNIQILNSKGNDVNSVVESNDLCSSVNECMKNNDIEKCINQAETNVKIVQNSEIDANTENNDLRASSEDSEQLGIINVSVVKELPANVTEMKNKGNLLYKTGRYDEACEMYTLCINPLLEDESGYKEALATLFSNRASCYMKMGNSKQCVSDCNKSMEFSQSTKVFLKRAIAYESLEKYLKAYVDYQHVLKLDSSSVNAFQAFSRLRNVLRSQYGNNWREMLPKTEPVPTESKPLNTTFSSINVNEIELNVVSNIKNMKEKTESELLKNVMCSDETASETLQHNLPSKSCLDEDAEGKISENSSEKVGVCTNETSVENINKYSTMKPNLQCKTNEGKVDKNVPISAKQQCENNTSLQSGDGKDKNIKTHKENIKQGLHDSKISKEKLAKEKKILDFFETKEKGNNCVQQEKYEEAIKYYTKCVEMLPAEIPGYTNRALCFLKLMQPEKAIEDCSQALKLQPSSVKALFRRAQARKMTKEYKEALADLTKVLKLEPNNNAAKKEMVQCKTEFHAALRNIQAQNEAAKQKDTVGKSKKIPIEEVLSESPEFSIKGKMSTKVGKCPLAKGSTSRTTQLKKMTGFEFLHAWNNVKSNKTAEYADLLMQIDATKLLDLLSNKLDGEILKNFIRTVNEHFTNKETYRQGIQLLKSLCKASRFVTMLMFLNTTEMTLLRCTIDLLENRVKQSSEKSLLSDISSLRTSYRCP